MQSYIKEKYITSQRKNEKGGVKDGRDGNKEGRKQNIGKQKVKKQTDELRNTHIAGSVE